MRTLEEFKASFNAEQHVNGLTPQLKSLWYDGAGDWHRAHAEVDHLDDQASAWVHAYLHRKEGDTLNADYWYGKARQKRPNLPLNKEWEQLVSHFLHGED